MQTQNLLPQLSSASPAPARQNAQAQAQPDHGATQFSRALSREITQRQNAAPAPQPKPAAQPKQAEKAAAARQEPNRPAQADSARQAAAKADSKDKPASASAPGAKDGADQAEDAAARASELPMTDMLALVASFNQLQAVPKDMPASAAPGSGGGANAGAAAPDGRTALPIDLSSQLAQDGAAGEQPAADAASASTAPAAAASSAAATAAQAGVQADAEIDASKFAKLLVQERAAPAVIQDAQAASTPLTGPVQQASLNIAQAAAGVATDRIAARVGTPAWDNQVGQKIVWMVAGQEQSATLTLNPPDMGPMQVVLSVTNDQATVTFSANQLEVRQALENAMPKLREMMSESGIALGNATVDAGTPDQRQAQGEQAGRNGSGGRFGAAGNALDVAEPQPGRPVNGGSAQGMVDIFA